MPIITVKVGAKESTALTAEITEFLLELTTRVLKKKREVTAIAIDYTSPANWSIGGVPLSEQNKTSFYFDIKITDETNTKDEKAQYLKEAFAGFERILGTLHETSYIYVQDVRAAAYGFGGKTQEYRYQNA